MAQISLPWQQIKIRRITFCSFCHGELMAKKWLDSIEKQRRRIDLKERYKQTNKRSDRVNDKLEDAIICGRICNMRILQHMRSHVRSYRMFSYNRYPYNCASVQRALLAPEILNESFLKCRYFTAL